MLIDALEYCPVLDDCCVCLDLRSGSIGYGIFGLCGAIFITFTSTNFGYYLTSKAATYIHPSFEFEELTINYGSCLSAAGAVHVVLFCVLLAGAIFYKVRLLDAFIWLTIAIWAITLVAFSVGGIFSVIHYKLPPYHGVLFFFTHMFVNVYFVVVVTNFRLDTFVL